MADWDRIIWIDPSGTEHELTDQDAGRHVLWGTQGRFLPPVKTIEEEIPDQDGSRHRKSLFRPRTIDLLVVVTGDDAIETRSRLRSFLASLSPARGMGTLKSINPDGASRQVQCRYTGGFEGEESQAQGTRTIQRGLLMFRAFDPFWADTSDTSQGFTTAESVNFFPFFPLQLSGESIATGAIVNNTGDVEAWPVWTINGPGSNLVLTNDTTGESLTLAMNLVEGEHVIIDTRPGIKTVRDDQGTNLYPDLSTDSVLWALARGGNTITVELTGATVASTVELSYRKRYLTV